VASLYSVASLSYSAACCEDCFLSVSEECRQVSLVSQVGSLIYVKRKHPPKSRSFASALASFALSSAITFDWSLLAMSFRDCVEVCGQTKPTKIKIKINNMKIVIQNPKPKPTPKRKRGCRVAGGCWGGGAHRLLQLGIFTLRVDEVEDDVERAREDEGEEETEAGEVGVALRAACVRGR
jgi:hypothetical protein